jgi:hypothetical protein
MEADAALFAGRFVDLAEERFGRRYRLRLRLDVVGQRRAALDQNAEGLFVLVLRCFGPWIFGGR